jgi:hypothetical protein
MPPEPSSQPEMLAYRMSQSVHAGRIYSQRGEVKAFSPVPQRIQHRSLESTFGGQLHLGRLRTGWVPATLTDCQPGS